MNDCYGYTSNNHLKNIRNLLILQKWLLTHTLDICIIKYILFIKQTYENLKLIVDIGGRTRTINLHNLENLSIIESIPDEIKMADGHPNLELLIDHFKKVATEYLEEMVLHIS